MCIYVQVLLSSCIFSFLSEFQGHAVAAWRLTGEGEPARGSLAGRSQGQDGLTPRQLPCLGQQSQEGVWSPKGELHKALPTHMAENPAPC